MPLELKPLHPLFVAEACGVDVTQPLKDEDRKAINAAMNAEMIEIIGRLDDKYMEQGV